jgi:hypothetical protein
MQTDKFIGVKQVLILHLKDYVTHAINTAEILLLTQMKCYSLHVQSCIFINDVHEGVKIFCLTVKCSNMEHSRTGMIQIHHCVFSSQLLQTSWIRRYTETNKMLNCLACYKNVLGKGGEISQGLQHTSYWAALTCMGAYTVFMKQCRISWLGKSHQHKVQTNSNHLQSSTEVTKSFVSMTYYFTVYRISNVKAALHDKLQEVNIWVRTIIHTEWIMWCNTMVTYNTTLVKALS